MIVHPDFQEPGTIPKPGPIGRLVRLSAGVVILTFALRAALAYRSFLAAEVPASVLLWLGAALSIFVLPDIVNIGWGRTWGRRPQLAAVLLGLAVAGVDLILYGKVWGPPMGALVFALIAYVTGHLGLSFVVQSLLATPG